MSLPPTEVIANILESAYRDILDSQDSGDWRRYFFILPPAEHGTWKSYLPSADLLACPVESSVLSIYLDSAIITRAKHDPRIADYLKTQLLAKIIDAVLHQ